MPSGKTHDRITYLALAPVFLVGVFALKLSPYTMLLFVLGTWIGGIFLGPDLDTRSRPFYRWGPVRFIWWPYQWVAKHRSVLSHGIFIGPVFRLLYLSAILVLCYFAYRFHITHAPSVLVPQAEVRAFFSRHLADCLLLGAGVWFGSLLHILLDGLVSTLKRRVF